MRQDSSLSGKAAEEALDTLANKEGDEAACAVLNQLSSFEIATIINSRAGLPSSVAYRLTPEQIVEAIKAQFLLIKDQVNLKRLADFQTEALHFFITVLIEEDDRGRKRQIIKQIIRSEESWCYLLLPFLGAFNQGEIPDEETLGLMNEIKEAAPKVAQRIVREAVLTPEQEIEEADWHGVAAWVNQIRRQLVEELRRAKIEEKAAEDMFKPL